MSALARITSDDCTNPNYPVYTGRDVTHGVCPLLIGGRKGICGPK
jgi:hypothetical protein